jgi:type I restriction enzyme S subunit
MKLQKYKLGELIEVTRGASLKGEFYATQGQYIRLTCGNFDYNNNSFKENKSKDDIYYTGNFNSDFLMKKGDIITPLTEQAIGLLGSTAIIPEDDKYIQSQDIAKITCNEKLLNKGFAFYLLSSNLVKQQLSAGAQQTKIRHTSPSKIKDCAVWIPTLSEQKRIGNLLSALDEKIALNRKINENLEAIAKQLYDYWFVQFDFPNEEGKPYKSSGGKMVWNEKLKREIPEGWEVEKLGDIIQELESGKRPKGGIEKSLKQGIPSLGAEAISKLGDFDYSKTPYIPYNTKINSGIIKNNDILIYKDGAYVGKVTLYRDNFPFEFATINEHVFLLRTTDPKIQEYIFFTLEKDYFFNIMQNLGKAKAAQPGLNKDDLKSIEILSPKKEIIYKYRTIIEPLMANLFNSAKQIADLTKQRDELLPLLMNGQVSVN